MPSEAVAASAPRLPSLRSELRQTRKDGVIDEVVGSEFNQALDNFVPLAVANRAGGVAQRVLRAR